MATVGDIVSAPGSRPYELLLEIGQGGMAKVFLGRAVGAGGFQRYAAIKVCREHLVSDPQFRGMFLDEARLAARIHHPNVVPTLDVGEGRELYLVMEYVEGGSLARMLSLSATKKELVPLPIALRIVIDALTGLHAAHETTDADGTNLGIVHRDASSHNVIVGVDGISRILDFGVARALSQSSTTKEGQIKGKIGYMPPEYLHAREVGRFTDVYAIGVVAWQVLAGRHLFHGETEGQTLTAVMMGTVPSLHAIRPEVPAELEAVIVKALHRDPGRRYTTAAEFAEALERCGCQIATARATGAHVTGILGQELHQRRQEIRTAERASARTSEAGANTPSKVSSPTQDELAAEGSMFEATSSRAAARWIAAATLMLAALGLAWWIFGGQPAHPASEPPSAAPPAAKVVTDVARDNTALPATGRDAGVAAKNVDAGTPRIKRPRQNTVRSRSRHDRGKGKHSPEWVPTDI